MNTVKLLKELESHSVQKLGFLKFAFTVPNAAAKMVAELKLDSVGRTHFIVNAEDSMRDVEFKVFDDIATPDQVHFVGWNLNKIAESNARDVARKSKSELNDFLVEHEIAKAIDLR